MLELLQMLAQRNSTIERNFKQLTEVNQTKVQTLQQVVSKLKHQVENNDLSIKQALQVAIV